MFRRLQAIALATILVVAAFSTGEDFLFYLLYLGILSSVGRTSSSGSVCRTSRRATR
jgi:hypothetical protein